MNKQELIKKIIQKKEFSKLPKKDVFLAFEKFDKPQYLDEEKIKLTRDLLRKAFSGFTSTKILSLKNIESKIKEKNEEWFLRKHLSTRERLPYYEDIYKRIFKNFSFKRGFSIIDLGAGINGFSYKFFNSSDFRDKINYLAVEAVGQLVELMNAYFKEKKLYKKGKARAVHLSLFEIEKIKELIKKTNSFKPKIIFLFKTMDSLEMLEKDYSKKLLKEIAPLADFIAVSFATRTMVKRKRFNAKRNWIVDFISNNFKVLDNFDFFGERYIIFCRNDK